MQTTLGDSLALVLPHLPATLVPRHALPQLRSWADSLAPIPRCGFETSLTGLAPVDLQQCVVASNDEPLQLRRHLQSHIEGLNVRGVPVEPGWEKVDDFLAQWADPASMLHDEIAELWWEFDSCPADLPLPSVFAGFRQNADAVPAFESRFQTAATTLDLLCGRASWAPAQAGLRRCFEACRGPAFVAHIGAMLGRPTSAIRVNTKRLSTDALAVYLHDVGWPGPIDEVTELMAQLYCFVEHITVCLDVGESVLPGLGFECILREQPPGETRWAHFLEELVQRGWCSAQKRDDLLAWPGRITPTNFAAWPSPLLAAALTQPPDVFTVVDRRLSHIKIVHQPNQTPQAKAYFGYEHQWLKPPADFYREGQVRRQMKSAGIRELAPVSAYHADARTLDEAQLRLAAAEATTFLLGARTPAGWWLDFPYLCRGFESWVTAVVATVLAALPDERGVLAARHAWRLLEQRQMDLGGWGCGINMPVDADSTSWAVRLALAVGAAESDRVPAAKSALEAFLMSDGGYTCYHAADVSRIVLVTGAVFDGPCDGWCKTPHTCLTASAAFLDDERPRDYLRRAQRADGSWSAHWWEEPAYSSAFAAEALAATGRLSDDLQVNAAIQWALGRIELDGAVHSPGQRAGSAFAAALCLRILVLAEDVDSVRAPLENCLAWLLRTQRPDGAWNPSARMLFPLPDVLDPHDVAENCASFLDVTGVFTTAFVLSAVESARHCLYHPADDKTLAKTGSAT